MTKQQKSNLPAHVKQTKAITLNNKPYKLTLITIMVMLSVALIIFS